MCGAIPFAIGVVGSDDLVECGDRVVVGIVSIVWSGCGGGGCCGCCGLVWRLLLLLGVGMVARVGLVVCTATVV